MIEMLGVLAIIGVLSAGGIMGYSAAMNNYRTNQTIDDFQTIVAAAQATLFGGNKMASDVNISAKHLLNLGIIPARYKLNDPDNCVQHSNSGCLVKSLFGENLWIWAEDGINGVARGIGLRLYKPSKAVCLKLGKYDWKSALSLDAAWVYVYKGGYLAVNETNCANADALGISFYI